MMNRLFKRGTVIALAAAMTTSAGIPAMAAQKETLEETVTTSEVTQTNVDYGSLTQKEIEEFNSIYDRLDAIDKEVMKDADGLSDEDIYARYDQYQDETDTLMDRLEELDKKAGWIDNEEYEYSEDECNALYDTGKLTAEEAEQLQKAYERIEEIDAEVWTDDDLSDDEIEARYAKYDDEITSLNAQIETLEKKAGWYEGYYGNLSEDEVNQLNSIYNKIDAIYDNIYNGSDNLSDEEFASRYANIQMRLMLWRHRQSLLKRKQVELKYRHTDFERYNMGNLTEFLRDSPHVGLKIWQKKSIWQMMNRIYEKYSQNFYPMPDMR